MQGMTGTSREEKACACRDGGGGRLCSVCASILYVRAYICLLPERGVPVFCFVKADRYSRRGVCYGLDTKAR